MAKNPEQSAAYRDVAFNGLSLALVFGVLAFVQMSSLNAELPEFLQGDGSYYSGVAIGAGIIGGGALLKS